MSNSNAELVLIDVAKTYVPGPTVLGGISMQLGPGESAAVTGPSGSGKSTLLNIIGSLDRPTSGVVRFGDIDIAALRGAALAEFRARRVGFVFQDHHLLPQLTALENVLLPSLAVPRPDAADRARSLLHRVHLLDRADSFPARMSGGERQRVAIARALVNQPHLLLCDEPTGNLDLAAGQEIISLLLELAAEDKATVLVVTHNLTLAARLSRRFELASGLLSESPGAPGGRPIPPNPSPGGPLPPKPSEGGRTTR